MQKDCQAHLCETTPMVDANGKPCENKTFAAAANNGSQVNAVTADDATLWALLFGGPECFKLLSSLSNRSSSDCLLLPESIHNLSDMLDNLMFDSVNEIKQLMKPIFLRPYLNVRL